MKNEKIKKYLQSLSSLSQSTEDFLFLWDIKNDENWFFGDVSEEFALRDKGYPTNKTEEMLAIVHPKDRKALKDDLQKIFQGRSKEHNMSYRWINRQGKSVWINCRGNVIDDDFGNPMVMLGRVSTTYFSHLVNKLTGFFNNKTLKQDMKELGLSGGDHSSFLRSALLKKLELPEKMSANALLQALNLLYSLEELKQVVNTMEYNHG